MKKVILFTLMGLSLLVTACAPQKEAGRANTKSANIVGGVGSLGQTTCGQGQSTLGAIYDQTSSSSNFENRVKGFLSAPVKASAVSCPSKRTSP